MDCRHYRPLADQERCEGTEVRIDADFADASDAGRRREQSPARAPGLKGSSEQDCRCPAYVECRPLPSHRDGNSLNLELVAETTNA